MVNHALHSLITAFANAQNHQQIRSHFMETAGELFNAQRWGIYVYDKHLGDSHIEVKGLPDRFVEQYEKIGRQVDPVLQYVLKYHAPAHEQLILTPQEWKQSLLYQNCCSGYDHEHIMTGPIVGRGELIGTVHFARTWGTPAFNRDDLAFLSGVCAHLSANLARIELFPQQFTSEVTKKLTPRELQIASLVAQGLTNAQIGRELWITQNSVKQALKRIFRKLNVTARAQMVARLQKSLDG
ncbi:GAF modulated transcriptional regulator, LuxR family [Gloeothece citriformis PCC 7424]|uniref:GAF modulated transcriptional regulator, LuxR family n=1 Tax=Gloeothece citriformis (strain PCC 7424) TaxID=65393 RepID=B7KBF2_GLOC7|nr:LuxR C-terminal-related transcriptional regulator [Gloeothece citriformis]ACK71508.1 GAF modulated transcriptional regulator, LuxR family [Gloeothece citriformis PCC 7424]